MPPPNKRLQPTAYGARDRSHFSSEFRPNSHLDLFGRRLKRERWGAHRLNVSAHRIVDALINRNARRACSSDAFDCPLSVPSEVSQRYRVMPNRALKRQRPNTRLHLTAFGARDRGCFE